MNLGEKNFYEMNKLYQTKAKIRKITNELNNYIEKDYKSSNNPLLLRSFRNFYYKEDENENRDSSKNNSNYETNNNTNNTDDKSIFSEKKRISLSDSLVNRNKIFDFNKENFSSEMSLLKKTSFQVLKKLFFYNLNSTTLEKNNFNKLDFNHFPLDFNCGLLNEIERINAHANKETFRKAMFILPVLNFSAIYLYHKNFGKLVRYKFSNYLKFSILASFAINLLGIPLIKFYYTNKFLNSTKINLNNFLLCNICNDTDKSRDFKLLFLNNFPDLINDKEKFFEISNIENFIKKEDKIMGNDYKKDYNIQGSQTRFSVIDNYICYTKLRKALKSQIYKNPLNNTLTEYRLFLIKYNKLTYEQSMKNYWLTMKRKILLDVFLNSLEFRLKEIVNEIDYFDFTNAGRSNLKSQTKLINKIKYFNKQNKQKKSFMLKKNFNWKKFKNYKNETNKNFTNLSLISLGLKKMLWCMYSKAPEKPALKKFKNYLNLIQEKEGKFPLNESNNDVKNNSPTNNVGISNPSLSLAKIFTYFKIFKKLNPNYANFIEIQEARFYLNMLTSHELSSTFMYSEIIKYLLDNKNLLYYLVNSEENSKHSNGFLKKDSIKNLNNYDFLRLIASQQQSIINNSYSNYFLFPWFSAMMLNFIFLKSFKYMRKLF